MCRVPRNTLSVASVNLASGFFLYFIRYWSLLPTLVLIELETTSSHSMAEKDHTILNRHLTLILHSIDFKQSYKPGFRHCHTAVSGLPTDVDVHFTSSKFFYQSFFSPRVVMHPSNSSIPGINAGAPMPILKIFSIESPTLLKFSRKCYNFIQVSHSTIYDGTENLAVICDKLLHFRQHNILYLFIGPKPQVMKTLTHKPVSRLTYKVAIFTERNEIYFPSLEFTHDQKSETIRTLSPDYVTRYARGQHFRAGSLRIDPYIVFDHKGDPLTGLSFLAIQDTALRFNMTYPRIKTEFKAYNKLPNGTWQGFMGDLTEDRLDIIFYMFQIFYRNEAVDFSTYVRFGHLLFYTAHPQTNLKWQAVFYPFDPVVWIAVISVLGLSIPVFYCHMITRTRPPQETYAPSRCSATYYAVAVPMAALLQQGIRIPCRVQLLSLCFILYAIVLNTFYSSNLISHITLPDPDEVPQTFTDLGDVVEEYQLAALGNKGGATAAYFNTNTRPATLKIRQKLNYTNNATSCFTKAIMVPKFACVSFDYFCQGTSARNLSIHPTWNPLHQSKEQVGMSILALNMQKYSRLYEFWNYLAGRWRDVGLITQWESMTTDHLRSSGVRWMRQLKNANFPLANTLHGQFMEFVGGKEVPFGLKHCVVAFSAVVIGAFLALIAFGLENLQGFVVQKEIGGDRIQSSTPEVPEAI